MLKVWGIAWTKEDEDYKNSCQHTFMYKVIDKPFFLIWWILSDIFPPIVKDCEIMAKLSCNTSLLKDSDYRLKGKSFSHKVCTECVLGIREDLTHLVMQCPANEDLKSEMFDVIKGTEDEHSEKIISEHNGILPFLMGKHPAEVPFESMTKLCLTSSRYISKMYRQFISKRDARL